MEKKFDGIYSKGRNLYTHAFVDGRVYGEKLITENGINYREWNPFKSKYCAGLTNGLKENIFFKGATVLYLGSAEGTTVSHVSDIVGEEGNIFCVDLSEIANNPLSCLHNPITHLALLGEVSINLTIISGNCCFLNHPNIVTSAS